MFDKYRKIFDDLANNYALAKLNEGKTGVVSNNNRVKFRNEDQKNRIADVVINSRPSQRKSTDENNLHTSAESYSDMVNKNYPQSAENNYNNRNVRNEVQSRPDNLRPRRE